MYMYDTLLRTLLIKLFLRIDLQGIINSTVCCTRTVVKIMKAGVHYESNIIECLENGSYATEAQYNNNISV